MEKSVIGRKITSLAFASRVANILRKQLLNHAILMGRSDLEEWTSSASQNGKTLILTRNIEEVMYGAFLLYQEGVCFLSVVSSQKNFISLVESEIFQAFEPYWWNYRDAGSCSGGGGYYFSWGVWLISVLRRLQAKSYTRGNNDFTIQYRKRKEV